jgi:CBS domain-containing protein
VTKIRDVMTRDVVAVSPATSVMDAAKTMIEQEKGPLPVVERDRPVGMITDRDLIAHVVAPGYDPRELTVADVATKDLITARPDQSLDKARKLLARHELDRLLVVEGNRLVGILSEADIRADEGPLTTTAGTKPTQRLPRARVQGRRAVVGLPLAVVRAALASLGVAKAVELIKARRETKPSPLARVVSARGALVAAGGGTAAGATYLGMSGKLQPVLARMRKGTAAPSQAVGSDPESAVGLTTPEEPPPPPGPVVP